MNIRLLPDTYDVDPVRNQLTAYPDLWDQHTWRTERGPHREVSDIWVRYNDVANFGPAFNDEHESVWYPVCEQIPAAKSLALEVGHNLNAKLGGVLITRVGPGKQVYPHIDKGWHALHFEKIGVQIAGDLYQEFRFDDAKLTALSGQSFWFNNQAPHSVINYGSQDRITMIVCIRRNH
jgi:hypothetical protein